MSGLLTVATVSLTPESLSFSELTAVFVPPVLLPLFVAGVVPAFCEQPLKISIQTIVVNMIDLTHRFFIRLLPPFNFRFLEVATSR